MRQVWRRYSDDGTPGCVYETRFSNNRVGMVYGQHGWGEREVGDFAWFICDKDDVATNFQKSFTHYTRCDVAQEACVRAGTNKPRRVDYRTQKAVGVVGSQYK